MKAFTLACFLFCFCGLSVAQDTSKINSSGTGPGISIEKHLYVNADRYKTDAPFTKKWAYPWWVVKHTDGDFENIKADTIVAEDTAHLYYTAYVKTTHQGNHIIHYSTAVLDKDTLILTIQEPSVAYFSWLEIRIVKGEVSSQVFCNYLRKVTNESIVYTITGQMLTVNTADFTPGTVLKGSLSVHFNEDFSAPGHAPESFKHSISGVFQTVITAKP